MKRKPAKIAVLNKGNGHLVVLCDDGSLWIMGDGKWTPIPPIPDSDKSEGSLADWDAGQ